MPPVLDAADSRRVEQLVEQFHSLTPPQQEGVLSRIGIRTPQLRELLPKRTVSEEEELPDGTILRCEYVPCGKASCRKEPDEHGPYWYSYSLLAGNLKATYHGRDRPPLPNSSCIDEATRFLSHDFEGRSLTEDERAELRAIAEAMSSLRENARAPTLEKTARELLRRDERRTEEAIRSRFEALISRRDSSPETFTAEERGELEQLSGLLESYR